MLAEEGPRGVSHLKVDRTAGVPDGTSSFYYRTRSALLHGVADQLVYYDAVAFTEAFKDAPNSTGDVILTMLADEILNVREEPRLSRTRARLELSMLARHDPELAQGFRHSSESYRALSERLIIAMQADQGGNDRGLLDEQVSVLMTYLNGLVFALANDAADELNRDDVRRRVRAVVIGVAAERWLNASDAQQ